MAVTNEETIQKKETIQHSTLIRPAAQLGGKSWCAPTICGRSLHAQTEFPVPVPFHIWIPLDAVRTPEIVVDVVAEAVG